MRPATSATVALAPQMRMVIIKFPTAETGAMPLPTAVLHLKPRAMTPRLVAEPATRTPPRFDSHALLRGQREILIEHAGEVYRLRHTRNDKLILTK
jgi:hemin uptake protein HemP